MLGYLRLQLHFLALGLREAIHRPAVPVPPPRLRHRVHGSTETRGYLEVGQRSWASIERLLREVGRDPDEFNAILDFGCGSGRVARQIPREGATAAREVHGADIDATAIRWCSRHLDEMTFTAIDATPPTPLPAGHFDLIFAISVFTHLDESMQFSWLAELRRLLRPGGILIASVHGDYHRSLHPRTIDLSRGFVFTTLRTGLFKKDGLPDFYQDAQHTRWYIEREWARFFRIVRYAERGIADHHDAVVLERSADCG